MTITLWSATYHDPEQNRIVLARITQDKHTPRVYDAQLAYVSRQDSTQLDAPCYGGTGANIPQLKTYVRNAAKRRGLVRVPSSLNQVKP